MALEDAEVLLVENDQNDAELVLRALRQHQLGVRVHVIQDGVQALDFVFCRGEFKARKSHSPLKLILLDLKLPKIDGFEVLETIKANVQTRHIPVVVFSSSGEDRDIISCYEAGANSFVVKPVDYDQFVCTVSALGRYWITISRSPSNQTG